MKNIHLRNFHLLFYGLQFDFEEGFRLGLGLGLVLRVKIEFVLDLSQK